ncbi:ATP-binding protein [Amycolatopsis anabasis]|uniref:ATP-binding protein n=1 Tax=Amycolatopsis anabasis TaxID=1840409 RepID=UPI00131C3513|nr:ATP-binding protein [Amycolatopsis anabasis]
MSGEHSSLTVLGSVSGPVVQAGHVHGDVIVQPWRPVQVTPRQVRGHGLLGDRGEQRTALDHIAQSDTGRCRMVQITGLSGVGKTALATGWLTSHLASYPDAFADGQLYVDLAARTCAQPHHEVADVLGMFLRALGVPAGEVPDSPTEREALYQSVTATRPRLAVVLDGATTAAQVLPLVPSSSSSLTLVTTRYPLRDLIALGANVLPVPPLDTRGVHQVLTVFPGIGEVDTDLAAVVATRTGGLTAAVVNHVVGAVASGTSLRELLAPQAAAHHNNLSTMEHTTAEPLEVAYHQLTGPERAVYLAIGGLPEIGAAFDAAAVAFAAGYTRSRTHATLRRLRDRMLVLELDDEVYRADPDVHQHARLQALQRPEAPQVRERLILWWVHAVRHAARTVMPTRTQLAWTPPAPARRMSLPSWLDDPGAALTWLAERVDAVLGIARMALENGFHREVLALAHALDVQTIKHGDHQIGIAADLLALTAARHRADPDLEFRFLRRLARRYAWLGNLRRAHALTGLCLAHVRRSRCPRQMAKTAKTLAFVHTARPDRAGLPAAARFHAWAADLYAGLGRDHAQGLAQLELGIVEHARGHLAEADRALRCARPLLGDDPHNLARLDLAQAALAETHGDGQAVRTLASRADHALTPFGESPDLARARQILRRCAGHVTDEGAES